VDYFTKMAEFVKAFNTYMYRKKLTKRQKFKKPNDFRQANAIIVFAPYFRMQC